MSEEKQYAERDLMGMDVAGNHYCRHISAMTREQLHSKSDIAAELGWRDLQIAELKAQRDALAAENAVMKSAISEHSEGFTVCPCCGTEHDSSHDDVCRAINETPATDAYLNSVRADAVASFAHHQRVSADSETDPTIQRGHRITASRAEDYAAQLRAGEPS